MPSRTKTFVAYLAIALASVLISRFAGSQELMERVELSRTDLSGTSDTEVIVARIKLAPGAQVPLHFHHGDVYAYIVQGGTVELKDQTFREDKPGTLQFFPRDQHHGDFTVVGDKTIEILSINIVDKGKPLVNIVEP